MPRELEEVALILKKVDLNLLQLKPLQALDANGKPITVQACTNPINWELFDPRTKRAASLKLMVVDNSEQRVTIRQAVQARAQLQEREMNKGLASLRREIFPSVEAAQAALNLAFGHMHLCYLNELQFVTVRTKQLITRAASETPRADNTAPPTSATPSATPSAPTSERADAAAGTEHNEATQQTEAAAAPAELPATEEITVVGVKIKAKAAIDHEACIAEIDHQCRYVLAYSPSLKDAAKVYNLFHGKIQSEAADTTSKNFFTSHYYLIEPERVWALRSIGTIAMVLAQTLQDALADPQ